MDPALLEMIMQQLQGGGGVMAPTDPMAGMMGGVPPMDPYMGGTVMPDPMAGMGAPPIDPMMGGGGPQLPQDPMVLAQFILKLMQDPQMQSLFGGGGGGPAVTDPSMQGTAPPPQVMAPAPEMMQTMNAPAPAPAPAPPGPPAGAPPGGGGSNIPGAPFKSYKSSPDQVARLRKQRRASDHAGSLRSAAGGRPQGTPPSHAPAHGVRGTQPGQGPRPSTGPKPPRSPGSPSGSRPLKTYNPHARAQKEAFHQDDD